jgi:DNA-binding protein HU-beta
MEPMPTRLILVRNGFGLTRKGEPMIKKDLVDIVAKKAHLTRRGSQEAIEVLLNEIARALKRGEKVLLSGFGTFKVVNVKDKDVVIPGTGERRTIKSHRAPRFVPGKPLKYAVRR